MLCNVPTEMLVRAPRRIAHATPCVGSGLGVGLMMLLSVGPRRVIRNPTFSNQCNAIATGREEEAELLRLDALQAITGNDRTCVLGSLVQLEDGMLALEDPHAAQSGVASYDLISMLDRSSKWTLHVH